MVGATTAVLVVPTDIQLSEFKDQANPYLVEHYRF